MSVEEFEGFYIEEPLLTFGDGKKYVDPKWGLKAFGPCLYESRRAISSSIKIGIIGSKKTIELAEKWISKCQAKIPGKKKLPLLFQPFPGFTRIFGCELQVLKEAIELITNEEIENVISLRGFRERVGSAAKLFEDKLTNIREREPRPHVVVCALPKRIIDYCGSQRKRFGNSIANAHDNEIVDMLEEHKRIIDKNELPFHQDEILDIIPGASDLRRLIKSRAMQIGIPTQLVRPSTFKTARRGSTLQDDATRAWNFCVALYYKAEGYPWKLAEMKQGTCYVGISFYKDPRFNGRIKTSVAQVFTHTGEGLVLKGGRALIDKKNRHPYLSRENAYNLLKEILAVYKKQMRQLPSRLVIHKSSKYRPEELAGFQDASKEIPLKDFITLLTRGIKFMRSNGIYPPARGTVIKVASNDYLVFTNGWIPFYKIYPGLRVPTPLEMVEHYGDTPTKVIFEEILALTKMNWNSADFCIREPITLAYAREVGKILAYVPEEVIPRPEYLYYM
jgi:hypothetical protein